MLGEAEIAAARNARSGAPVDDSTWKPLYDRIARQVRDRLNLAVFDRSPELPRLSGALQIVLGDLPEGKLVLELRFSRVARVYCYYLWRWKDEVLEPADPIPDLLQSLGRHILGFVDNLQFIRLGQADLETPIDGVPAGRLLFD